MAAALQEVLGERYESAVAAGDIYREVAGRYGSTVAQVEHRVKGSNLFLRTMPQMRSWQVEVGDMHGANVELPLGTDLSYSSEPVKLVVEKSKGGKTFVAARDQLSQVSSHGVGYLTALFMNSEVAHQDKTTALAGVNVAKLAASDPETGTMTTVTNLALGLMRQARYIHQQKAAGAFAEYDLTPFGTDREDGYCLRTWAIHPPTTALITLQGGVNATSRELTGEDVMCSLQFGDIQAWETHDGMVAADEIDLLLEDSEAIMLNEASDAGFSHLASDSLARIYEILRNSVPCKRTGA